MSAVLRGVCLTVQVLGTRCLPLVIILFNDILMTFCLFPCHDDAGDTCFSTIVFKLINISF